MTKRMKGYAGKQLRVKLGDGGMEIEDIREDWAQDYLGGAGYAAKLLYEELSPGVDPLGTENKLVLSTGPLTMNKVPGGGSLSVCFKSPLTEGWGEARVGSDFGPEIRRAGFDHIIIEGRSETPVFLVIEDGKAELRAGGSLSGKTVSEKKRILVEEVGLSGYQVLTIGPGGENLVRFATVMIDDRAAGRGGGGAVLGSKNLLAIAVKGSTQVPEADPAGFKTAIREVMDVLKEHPNSAGFLATGTIGDLPGNDDGGDWPTKNWQSNSWGKGPEIYDHYEKHNFIRPYGCYRGCYIRCGRKVQVADGVYQTPQHGGAEYESISCFTAYVLNEDVDAAVHCTWLCNEQGIDTITAGAMIAFAMECYEKGLISKEDADGLELTWGNASVLPRMVMMMAGREGLGDLLAEGVRRTAARLGGGADEFAVHVKGLEGPAHDPRSGKALAVTYGTSSRGMCHIHPVEAMAWDSGKMDFGLKKYGLSDPESVERWDERGKGEAVRILQDGLILPDVLGICKFFMYAGLTIDHLAAMLSALTGKVIDGKVLMVVGERVANLQRLFNYREGFTNEDDTLPARVRAVPVMGKYQSEPDCAVKDYEGMLAEYYAARGWHPETGAPTEAKLRELGLA
jgi:aldehyde:ferredoxin oxidoreductase